MVETLATARNPSGGQFPGSRDPDALLIYDPAYGARTGTNPWGAEATIEDGLVTRVGGNDSAIPADGAILEQEGLHQVVYRRLAQPLE